MTAAARALTRGNVILSVPVRVGYSLLGILGNGDARMYPLGRFPTHPLRALGADALGSTLGELCSWRYHGRTSMWCLPSKCFV